MCKLWERIAGLGRMVRALYEILFTRPAFFTPPLMNHQPAALKVRRMVSRIEFWLVVVLCVAALSYAWAPLSALAR